MTSPPKPGVRVRRIGLVAVVALVATLAVVLRIDGREDDARSASPPHRGGEPAVEEAQHVPPSGRVDVRGDVRRVAVAGSDDRVEDPPAVPPTFGTVRARLVLVGGEPIREGRIQLVGSSRGALAVDESGWATFERVPFGEYWVRVEEGSLPSGLLPPLLQDIRIHAPTRGAYRTELALSAETPAVEVELVVQGAATIHGRVLGPTGEPVEHAFVMAQSTVHNGLQSHGFTDELGRYSFERVTPSSYWIQVSFDERYEYSAGPNGIRYENASQPPPVPFEIESGGVVQRDVVLGTGSCSITGAVVDQDGEPFPDLEVLAYYKNVPGDGLPRLTWGNRAGRAVTDSRGEYSLERLHPGRIGIQVAPNALRLRDAAGNRLLGDWPEHVEVELRGRDRARAPRRIAYRSRPFRVFGKITLDPAWAARFAAEPDDLDMKLIWPPRTFPPGEEPDPLPAPRQDLVEVEADGSYEWACETPVSLITVRLEANWTGTPPTEVHVAPLPDTTIEMSLAFP